MSNITETRITVGHREQFIDDIKKWVTLDTQLKLINEKMKSIRNTKTELNSSICNYIKANNLTTNKITLADGELSMYEKKEYNQLTYAYIEKTLAEIIPDKSNLEYIIKYLKEKRGIKYSNEIKRTMK